LRAGVPVMLKITSDPEERHGHELMKWWAGDGAAEVLAHADGALLLKRARGGRSLVKLATNGRDDEATRIICEVAARLHAPRGAPPSGLVPLKAWFEPLAPVAKSYGGILLHSAAAAHELLASEQDVRVLHGDLHHENILDFEGRGWLAIDPKRLIGERTFEYTILFCDPDLGIPGLAHATRPEIFERRVEVVTEAAGLERERLLMWILAWTGLSAAWTLGDGQSPLIEFQVAEMAFAALNS
jgi:streptomycin 6-kinase